MSIIHETRSNETEVYKYRYQVENTIKDIITDYPLLFRVLVDKPIVFTKSVETASITKDGEILINPDFWDKARSDDDRAFILLHEALHWELVHHPRFENLPKRRAVLWNFACDAVINNILSKIGLRPSFINNLVTIDKIYQVIETYDDKLAKIITEEKLEKMSEEEIYNILLKLDRNTRGGYPVGEPGGETDREGGKREQKEKREEKEGKGKDPFDELRKGSVLHEDGKLAEKGGEYVRIDPIISREKEQRDKRDEKDLEKELEERRRKTVSDIENEIRRKLHGTEAGDTEEFIRNLYPKGKINWVNYIVGVVNSISFGTPIATYARPSRRVEELPHRKFMGGEAVKALFLVDTSGSIDTETLRTFLNEILHAKKMLGNNLTGYIAFWDTKVNDVIRIEELNPSGVKVTGRGGTVIDDALKFATEKAKSEVIDFVVVLTDGAVLLEDKNLPNEVARYTKRRILAYTVINPDFGPLWEHIKY